MFTGWLLAVSVQAMAIHSELPVVVVDRDNIEIKQSCKIEIKADHIVDTDGNGVVHINTEGIAVDFCSQRLHGAPPHVTPDQFTGFGVKINAKNITLKNLNVSGYKVGIHAIDADGLTIHHCDISNNFHQRLKSTPQAEDASDWLWPHANDDNEWMKNYGAGICVEDSSSLTLHNIRARKTQNGIILDRVNESAVFDCDCSFLSGWGLAMWRSNRNVISRNAFDFCVRGYSHGVYNRGQDSAGILMFEQCSENVIAENSVTHGGDGFFGFAGKEALGEVNPRDDLAWYKRRGCNDNIFTNNDFSYAPAHGLELTFSFGNRIYDNTFSENAICGIWAGYSRETMIDSNTFKGNGDMAYGLERGGINIEHGARNTISGNEFSDNKCGVHLWWDDDGGLLKSSWCQANGGECESNRIFRNRFERDTIAVHLRKAESTKVHMNVHADVKTVLDADDESRASLIENSAPDEGSAVIPVVKVIGRLNPFQARQHLAGRENIIMTEWGPWDHESPLLRFERTFDHADHYKLFKSELPKAEDVHIEGSVAVDVDPDENSIIIRPLKSDSIQPYAITFDANGTSLAAHGTLTGGTWNVKSFKSACDPREDLDRWRREGMQNHHVLSADALHFRFANRGMSELMGLPVPQPRDHFGVIATRTLTFPAGTWKIQTTSDDGIRVMMSDRVIIEDWTHHGPTRHEYTFTLEQETAIEWVVEFFELDGHAVLALEFERLENPKAANQR